MLKSGTTLYSLTIEWLSGKYSLEEIIAETSARKLGPGLEVVGFQTIRNFPSISSEFAVEFRRLLDEYELEPSCLGANADIGIRRSGHLTIDETAEYLKAQIIAASKLGFPVLRMQMAAKPEVIRKLVTTAEKSKVILGMELHSPYTLDHPSVIELQKLYDEIDSPCLGYIPDFGCCMQRIPSLVLDSFRKDGMPETLISLIKEIWLSDADTAEKFKQVRERAIALKGTPSAIGRLNMILALFSRQDPKRWSEIMNRIVHIHGKFYGFDAEGNEPISTTRHS
ncbi:MAG: sugar phosphate isomerase/epimerase [Bacteroidetes bacterium]|nr:sugar phosphate isomerase/epimerase [Bacteroidota bacterium]